jgi:hypothetical protein
MSVALLYVRPILTLHTEKKLHPIRIELEIIIDKEAYDKLIIKSIARAAFTKRIK